MRRVDYHILEFKHVTNNSRDVKKGDLFVAIKGTKSDGHEYVEKALKDGAAYCIVSREWYDMSPLRDDRLIAVHDTRDEYAYISSFVHDFPSTKLKMVGITGTNGKTTVSYLLEKIFSDQDKGTGVIGTVCYKTGKASVPASRTTPDAMMMNGLLCEMVTNGLACAVMEVSSHALEQKRVGHLLFDVAVFTNLTPEHLDYHKDMDSYFKAKAKLFDKIKSDGAAVINVDDPRGRQLAGMVKDRMVITYGIKNKAAVMAKAIKYNISSTEYEIRFPGGSCRVKNRLVGPHNVSNTLAAFSAAYALGFDSECAARSLSNVTAPPGRLEPVNECQDFSVFVDYAHTEDALKNVLKSIRPYVKGRLITVFGCGGDRDKLKRPKMGGVASSYSDHIIITSDNPRSEEPGTIAAEIVKGIKKNYTNYSIILDRKEAIAAAITMAGKDDAVIIAGKGHEAEQIFRDRTIKFDDKTVAKDIIKHLRKGH